MARTTFVFYQNLDVTDLRWMPGRGVLSVASAH